MCICDGVLVCVYVCVCICVRVLAYRYVCVCVCAYMYVYWRISMYVCVCVCICVRMLAYGYVCVYKLEKCVNLYLIFILYYIAYTVRYDRRIIQCAVHSIQL